MLTRNFGTLLGTVALGLLAACSNAGDNAASSESAVTEGADDQQGIDNKRPHEQFVDSIGNICSLGGKADFAQSGGKIATYSSCGKAGEPGIGVMMDLTSGEHITLSEGKEVHGLRMTSGSTVYGVMDRTEGSKSLKAHIDLATKTGMVSKDIDLFDKELDDTAERLQDRLQNFNIKVSPDGKTLVAYGFEKKGDGYEGLLVVAPTSGEGQTVLKPTKAISPDADVTFSPGSSRVVILSTMGYAPAAPGDAVRQQIYDITLGEAPTLTESPEWILGGHKGEVTVVPGSFDGNQVLRFDVTGKDGQGLYEIARVDNTVVPVSAKLLSTAHAPGFKTDAEMHDNGHLAALVLRSPEGATAQYIVPGHTTDTDENAIFVIAADGQEHYTIATDATTDHAGFAQAYAGGLLYDSKSGVALVDIADNFKVKVVAKNAQDKIFFGTHVSSDGKIALVQSLVETTVKDAKELTTGYATVEIATGKSTELKTPSASKLRFFGPLEGEWKEEACQYDAVSAMRVLKDGRVVALAKFGADKTDCKRTVAAPEVMTFEADGSSNATAFEKVDAKGGAPHLQLASVDRGIVTQCGLAGDLCAAFLMIPPGLEPKPAKPVTDKPADGTDGDATDTGNQTGSETAEEGDEEAGPMPKGKAKKNSDDTDDGVVVTTRPTSNGADATAPSANTAIPTTTSSTGGCTAAPGSTNPTGLGLGVLLGLTVLARRRSKK